MLILRGLLGGVLQLLLFGSLLLIPAGTWNWPRAIQFLVAYGIVLSAAIVWLAAVAPSSLEARLEPAINKKQPVADRIATGIIAVAFAGWFIFIPTDVFRLKLLPPPSLGVSVLWCRSVLGGFRNPPSPPSTKTPSRPLSSETNRNAATPSSTPDSTRASATPSTPASSFG